MLIAVLGTVLLQLAVIYSLWLNIFFHTQLLTLAELSIAFGVSAVVFVVVEIEKKVKRKLKSQK